MKRPSNLNSATQAANSIGEECSGAESYNTISMDKPSTLLERIEYQEEIFSQKLSDLRELKRQIKNSRILDEIKDLTDRFNRITFRD